MSEKIKVMKFGGASVKNAEAALNAVSILKRYQNEKLVVVVSAMGKTTNNLEQLVNSYFKKSKNTSEIFAEIKKFHTDLTSELFKDPGHPVFKELNNLFVEIDWVLEEEPLRAYDFIYDQIVSIGELLSSKIISALLNEHGIYCQWQDARDFIHTDNSYREGKVNWALTLKLSREILLSKNNKGISLTQGFIGSTSENYTTTLGREGSDYTAAILAYCLDASELIIWKDVPGVLNADPKIFKDAVKLETVSYQDAIELAYYGASVIHPKTIQPLQNKQIPLFVKSFISPDDKGTLIGPTSESNIEIPSYIFKTGQTLISISALDFSFIVEENLSSIFSVFARFKVKINLMQNSAISFSVCVDTDLKKTDELVTELKTEFKVRYNSNLRLLTIRHYNQKTFEKLTAGKNILMEQRSRNTLQVIMQE